MEATTAERYASGGPGKDLHAQNLVLAFEATVERIPDDPAIVAGQGDDQVSMTWREVRERAWQANNLGVAYLEQFNYAKAATQFEAALAIDGALVPARVNLWIRNGRVVKATSG